MAVVIKDSDDGNSCAWPGATTTGCDGWACSVEQRVVAANAVTRIASSLLQAWHWCWLVRG
jgi:hypothetical protein